MRTKEMKRIVQHLGGLFGLLIVILSFPYMDGYTDAIWDILTDYKLAMFYPGLGLIPFIARSGQKYQILYYDEIAYTELSTTAIVESADYEIPVASWLTKVSTTIFQETAVDQDAKAVVAWHGDNESRTFEMGSANQSVLQYMIEHWSLDSVTEVQTNFPVQKFWIENSVNTSDVGSTTHVQGYGKGNYYSAGETIQAATSIAEESTGMTQGLIHITSVATFEVACFRHGGKNRVEEVAPYVHIMGDATSGDSGFHWPANTNMRIANLRATVYQGLATSSNGWLAIDKNVPDLTQSTDTLELHRRAWLSIIHPVQDATGGGEHFAPVVTNYARGPFYLKKGEALQVRHNNITSYFSISFQYIPDFGYLAEFTRHIESSDYQLDFTAQYLALFTVPYDMYITSVEGFIGITPDSAADSIWEVKLLGLKQRNLLDSNDLLLTYSSANVEGNILGADNQAGSMPFTLKSIPMVADSDGTNVTTYSSRFAEAIADYYPAGSSIGFWFPSNASTNIAVLASTITIEGLNRIKTQAVGTDVLEGRQVTRLEMIAGGVN